MPRLPIIVLATLALGASAGATEQGASSTSPGREMQHRGRFAGSPGASGCVAGHETKFGGMESTGLTTQSGGGVAGSLGSDTTVTRR